MLERPGGTEGRDHHRHAGADIRALEALADELRGTGDNGAVRIAEDDPCPHRDELVDEEQAALEHLLEHEHGAGCLGRGDDCDRGQVGRERRPDAALDLGDLTAEVVHHLEFLAGWHTQGRRPHLQFDPELAERRHDRDRSSGSTSSIVKSPPVTAASAAKRSRPRRARVRSGSAPPPSRSTPWIRSTFEPIPSIRAPSVTRKRQRSWMCGSQAACPTIDSPSARTAAMIAFSVAITEASSRKRRLPTSPFVAQVVGAVQVDLDPELGKRVDVGVESPTSDHVAAGRRHDGAPEACEERPGEEERGADLAAEIRIELGLRDVPELSTWISFGPVQVASAPSRRAAPPSSRHRGCGADSRAHGFRREHGRGEDRQARRSCSRRRGPCPRAGDHRR